MTFDQALALARRPASQYLLGWAAKEKVMDAALDLIERLHQGSGRLTEFEMALFTAIVERAK